MPSMRDELDAVPPLGDIATAIQAGKQGRIGHRRRVAATLLGSAAAVAAGATLLAGYWDVDRAGPSAVAPPASDGESAWLTDPIKVNESIRDWVPETEVLGEAAPSASVLARVCDQDDPACEWKFVDDRGRATPATEVSRPLAQLLNGVGAEAVSVSYDGRWLSIDLGESVRVQSLDPERSGGDPIVLKPQTIGRNWDVVGWGSGSLGVALAESTPDGVPTRFANVDLGSGSIVTVTAPEPDQLGPIGDAGIGLAVAKRVPPGSASGRVTEITPMIVATTDQPDHPAGAVRTDRDYRVDVSSLLSDRESLTGPDGLPDVSTPPVTAGELDWPVATVFSADGLQRTGVIRLVRDGPTRLLGTEGWQVLGTNRYNTIVETSIVDGESIVRSRSDDEVVWTQRLRGQVDWVIPGLVL